MRVPRRRCLTLIGLVASVCVAASGCARPQTTSRDGLDLAYPTGVTAYFILGFLDEPSGRTIVEGDDLVERLFCEGPDKTAVLTRELRRFAHEQGLAPDIRVVTRQRCVTEVRSPSLAWAVNGLYVDRRPQRSWVTDDVGGRHFMTKLFSDQRLFQGVDRRLKLAYLAGAWVRHGDGDSYRITNAQHKVKLLVALLRESGCADVRTTVTRGLIPQVTTIEFQPTPEVRAWLHRRW
ncbi:MAG TPA: hypothetical protein VNE16_03570 [Vicinamibacterales bacterium]|nr:hypothetical protein [Vicinamibacterales bacterium]